MGMWAVGPEGPKWGHISLKGGSELYYPNLQREEVKCRAVKTEHECDSILVVTL